MVSSHLEIVDQVKLDVGYTGPRVERGSRGCDFVRLPHRGGYPVNGGFRVINRVRRVRPTRRPKGVGEHSRPSLWIDVSICRPRCSARIRKSKRTVGWRWVELIGIWI